MKKAEIPNNEENRLKALREYKVLDTAAEANLDEITQLVSEICETPIALLTGDTDPPSHNINKCFSYT